MAQKRRDNEPVPLEPGFRGICEIDKSVFVVVRACTVPTRYWERHGSAYKLAYSDGERYTYSWPGYAPQGGDCEDRNSAALVLVPAEYAEPDHNEWGEICP